MMESKRSNPLSDQNFNNYNSIFSKGDPGVFANKNSALSHSLQDWQVKKQKSPDVKERGNFYTMGKGSISKGSSSPRDSRCIKEAELEEETDLDKTF
jgi:hypothetical protein